VLGVSGVALVLPGTTGPAQARECTVNKPVFVKTQAYALQRLSLGPAWSLANGRGVTVAVVDSGVDDRNVHFKDGVLAGKSFVPGDGGDGQTDSFGHGTAVAGIIAARPVNPSTVVGEAYGATILPVRVFVRYGQDATPTERPDTVQMAEGIRWAAAHGADVINVSMSTGGGDVHLGELRSAVHFAVTDKDAIVVAAGGNVGDGTSPRYPAGFPGVIGVAASDDYDFVDDSKTISGPHIDVYAPGANIPSTYRNARDCVFGPDDPLTSYSTPYVSGLAALLKERFPEESAEMIEYRIMASADRPVRGRRDDTMGWGLIQPYEALTMTLDPNRPGPPFPGVSKPRAQKPPPEITSVAATADPMNPARRAILWWGLLATGFAALAFVVRPWVTRRTSRDVRSGEDGPGSA
jgi:type VII secretion-associated serine protease mycosin